MIKTLVMGFFSGAAIGTGFKFGTELFSFDGILSFYEFLIVFAVLPILITLLTRKLFRTNRWSILPVCYLTLLIPVLGASFGASGSEPLWTHPLLGGIGGLAWIAPLAFRNLIRRKRTI